MKLETIAASPAAVESGGGRLISTEPRMRSRGGRLRRDGGDDELIDKDPLLAWLLASSVSGALLAGPARNVAPIVVAGAPTSDTGRG